MQFCYGRPEKIIYEPIVAIAKVSGKRLQIPWDSGEAKSELLNGGECIQKSRKVTLGHNWKKILPQASQLHNKLLKAVIKPEILLKKPFLPWLIQIWPWKPPWWREPWAKRRLRMWSKTIKASSFVAQSEHRPGLDLRSLARRSIRHAGYSRAGRSAIWEPNAGLLLNNFGGAFSMQHPNHTSHVSSCYNSCGFTFHSQWTYVMTSLARLQVS